VLASFDHCSELRVRGQELGVLRSEVKGEAVGRRT
jgi:hypothetical protein